MTHVNNIFPIVFNTIFFILALVSVTGSKYSIKKTLLIIIPSTLILLTLNLLLFVNYKDTKLLSWLILSVYVPESIIVSIISKKEKLSLITCILNVFIGFFLIYIFDPMLYRIFKDNSTAIVICYISCFPIVFALLYFAYAKLHNLVEQILPKFLVLLTIYAVGIIGEIIVYQFLLSITNDPPLRLEVFGIGILSVYFISIVGIYIFVYFYNRTISESVDKTVLKRQIEIIQENAVIKNQKDNDLRILRHDMKHLIVTSISLLKSGNVDEALDLLSSYQNMVEHTTTLTFTKEPFVNSILEYYYNKCQKHNIDFEVIIDEFESILNVPIDELALVISNILDNAVTASLTLNENRHIRFKFINNNGRLILQVKNNFKGKVSIGEDNLPTSKKDSHGLGTKSIEKFVKTHKLTLDYQITKKTFKITILF